MISNGSQGLSIPQEVRRALGIRPGTRLMVSVERVDEGPTDDAQNSIE